MKANQFERPNDLQNHGQRASQIRNLLLMGKSDGSNKQPTGFLGIRPSAVRAAYLALLDMAIFGDSLAAKNPS